MAKQKAAEKAKVLAGGVTQQQIDSWKAQHGKDSVKIIEVDRDKKTTFTGYFSKPTLDILAASETASGTIPQGEILWTNCHLGGDPEIVSDPEIKFGAMLQLHRIFQVKKARIKNV